MANEEAPLMLEIEIKARIENPLEIEQKIISAGGVFIVEEREDDEYYNHPSRDFVKTGEAFRIRITDNGSRIAYKGPKLGGKAKTRYEAETSVGDASVMKSILSELGFVFGGSVSKKRREFKLNDCLVCLDSVKFLGEFIEIEMIGTDRDRIEHEIFACAELLGVKDIEPKSYLSLILAKK